MTAFLSWVRPESVSIDPTLADGLQARVADPLWLLGRQIGFGELSATDGGSPVSVSGTAIVSQLSRLRAGPGPGPPPHQAPGQQRPDAAPPGVAMLPPSPGAPLEAVIEAEPEPTPYPPPASAMIMAAAVPRPVPSAQAGMHYVRLLRAAGISDSAYIAALATTFPVPGTATAANWPAAAASDPLIRLYAGRVPDGQTLYGNLTQPRPDFSTLPAGHPAPAAGFASVSAIAQSWLSWYEQTCSVPAGLGVSAAQTWQPMTMEYAADLAAPGPAAETILRAGEHTAGPLDWYDFDLLASSAAPAADATVSLGASSLDPAGGADQTVTWTALPVAATYPGAPNPRWWTFEDGAVNFGDINAASEGSVTAVVVEYALRYGNDHFIIPLPLRIGSLARLSRLVVTTTFGEQILIRPVAEVEPDGPFRLFELSGPDVAATQPRDPLIVMLPTVPEALAGPALESVTYARDEIAETVWAIEQDALGPLGLPVDLGTSPGSPTPPTIQQSAPREPPHGTTCCTPEPRRTGTRSSCLTPSLTTRPACGSRQSPTRKPARPSRCHGAPSSPRKLPTVADYHKKKSPEPG